MTVESGFAPGSNQVLRFDGSMDTFDVSTTHSDDEIMVEGSLEVKLPTIWTVEKQRLRRVRREKIRRKKMQVREKVGTS